MPGAGKEMVLQGLVGCTGLDVAAIMTKKKVHFEKLEVSAEADPADRKHIERAIELSEKQFCGVSKMLRQSAEISWELEIDPIG
ncbi:MAG: OsmC family protein [Deltaproteobacteria bacterium]|nr:OsmC family protein [Deltaproteobacteria bacterium]